MEANIQFMRVFQAMRAEINKLEKENQALRMKLTLSAQRALSSEETRDEQGEDETEQSPAALHHDVSPDAAGAMQGHQGNVMIVRRYFISSPSVDSFTTNDPWKAGKRNPTSKVLQVQGTVKPLACSSIKKEHSEENVFAEDSFMSNSSSQGSSPERGLGCRDKTKTVSFLLPKNSSSLKYSASETPKQLNIIAE
ncbi:putative coiled-coil domain-containing protein 195 [Lepus europaeus]|uniref:putative coiled-coil domain-containing protein 195 n=1 Tax=Lepus europaeus TaxID=9983 RepID=UPI002B45A8FE|nr:putative coiled-coil domain-containing protein 195 [Lepus europaeus]